MILTIILIAIIIWISSIYITIKLDDYYEKLDPDNYNKIPACVLVVPCFNIVYYLVIIIITLIENKIE